MSKRQKTSASIVIDLTLDEPSFKTSSAHQYSPPIEIDDVVENVESSDEEPKQQLFQFSTKIVGKRFYNGKMNDGEIVYLIREPNNKYDSNAIKVLSLTQQQVGHIIASDGTAGILAPIMDYKLKNGAGGDLEAVVVHGSHTNSFSSIVDVVIVGLLSSLKAIEEILMLNRIPHINFITGQYHFNYKSLAKQSKSPSSIPSNYVQVSEEDVIRQLDGLWEAEEKELSQITLQSDKLNILKSMITSELYPHQLQGIAWMLNKELDKSSLPPFYEESVHGGRKTYFHTLLKYNFDTKPINACGGMLCDEMGLGKSLMTLALIGINPSLPQPPIGSSSSLIPVENSIKSPTLIVCPVSVISSWQDQAVNHFQIGTFKVMLYYGSSRAKKEAEIYAHDIVITSYQTLAQEHDSIEPSSKKRPKLSFLERINWHRIVLDEGHTIRNTKTNAFKACQALQGNYRWFLSGTPIVNSVSDVQCAVQFLRLSPFSNDESLFPRYITRPIKSGNFESVMKLRALVKVIALKRLKQSILTTNIPPKKEIIVNVELSPPEREAYDAISAAITDFMNFAVQDGNAENNIMTNSSTILSFVTRLRQCCLDFSLVPTQSLVNMLSAFKTKTSHDQPQSVIELLSKEVKDSLLQKFNSMFSKVREIDAGNSEDDNPIECCICLNNLNEEDAKIFKTCKHSMCGPCIDRLFLKTTTVKCPLCRIDVSKRDCISFKELKISVADTEIETIFTGSPSSPPLIKCSAKTTEILHAIKIIREQNPDNKIVIFSSFVSYLQILRNQFQSESISTCYLVGSMTQKQRNDEIVRFTNDDSVPVILCSLKAAGVGITLTRANHIFLSDLWWSPSADLQAVDRVHRLGQTKTVHVKRFLVSNSIDQKIYALQREKLNTSQITFDMSREQAREQRLKDIQALLC